MYVSLQCVICINAKATMQTSPCGHQVVCRKCFVKTIQMAVSQRLLPLRCVICRAKILRLKQTPDMPTSVSGYSVASSSGASVPASDSLYSVSSGGSSASEASSLSCSCHGRGAYPRQPTGALKRSQQHAMKVKLQDFYHGEKGNVCRLPPIREMSPHAAPRAATAPGSTRIRCAQKIVTQLETAPAPAPVPNYFRRSPSGYERVPTSDPDMNRRWPSERSVELVDNRRNELAEKKLAESDKRDKQPKSEPKDKKPEKPKKKS